MTRRLSPASPLALAACGLMALLAALPAQAQYKIVGPDGRVTYTDRPPSPQEAPAARREPLPAAATPTGGGNPPLPLALRQTAARFPVVLYTVADCAPCDSARQALRQRGIPYNERQLTGSDELPTLERLTGGRGLPALTVGTQALHGWAASAWAQTLDLAGYPAASQLPRGWTPAPVRPLVERAAAPPPAPVEAPEPAPEPPPPPASGIRF